MFGLIKKTFSGLLTSLVNRSNHTKCVSLCNHKCMTLPTLINLYPNEYSQEFHYYALAVKLDRRFGSCNTLNDLSNKVCVRNKTEDLDISMFNMITGINESKTLTKHISCKCKCRFDGGIAINVNVKIKELMHVKKDYVWNPAKCNCENGKCLASIMDNVIWDETIDIKETNFNEKLVKYKFFFPFY